MYGILVLCMGYYYSCVWYAALIYGILLLHMQSIPTPYPYPYSNVPKVPNSVDNVNSVDSADNVNSGQCGQCQQRQQRQQHHLPPRGAAAAMKLCVF